MAHALPDTEPQPTTRPELFTLTFWLIATTRMVRGAAVGAMSVLGAYTATDHMGGAPWYGTASGALIGGIMSLLASLSVVAISISDTPATITRLFPSEPPRRARITGGRG